MSDCQPPPPPDRMHWPKGRLTPRRWLIEQAFHLLGAVAMRRRPATLAWDLTWFPTFQCNLRCWYCNEIYGKAEPPDLDRAVQRIIALHPASISILGGEPYLLARMNDALARLREALPQAYIMVTTNGMVSRQAIVDSVPLIDTLCFSIDGEGDDQARARGGDSETILANIHAAHQARRHSGRPLDLVANSVVSRYNAPNLPAFYRKLKNDIAADILAFCQGLQPFSSPHSIAADPAVAQQFVREMKALKQEMRVLVAGQLADDSLRRLDQADTCADDVPAHRLGAATLHCHQERFYPHVSPGGRVRSCALYSRLNALRGDVLDCLLKKNHLQALRLYLRGWRTNVLQRPSFDCECFQGCPEWAEDIMQSTTPATLPAEIERVRGRLTKHQVRQSARFIQRRVNPQFDPAVLRRPRPDDAA